MKKIIKSYVKPSIEVILTEPVKLLDESLPFLEDEISDPTEIE